MSRKCIKKQCNSQVIFQWNSGPKRWKRSCLNQLDSDCSTSSVDYWVERIELLIYTGESKPMMIICISNGSYFIMNFSGVR